MAKGHVKLDGRDYLLRQETNITRSNANQVTVKVGGSNEYDDYMSWSNWVMDDWQAGMGKRDPEGGGWLYGSVNGLYKGQLLPCAQPSSGHERLGINTTARAAGITVALVGDDPTAAYEKISGTPGVTYSSTNYGAISGVMVILPGRKVAGCTATAVEVEIQYGNNSPPDNNTPLNMASSGVINLIDDNKYHWHYVSCGTWTPPSNYSPIVLITTDSGVVPLICKASGGAGQHPVTGSWAAGPCPIFWLTVNIFDINEGLRWPFAYKRDGNNNQTFWAGGFNYTGTTDDTWALNPGNAIGTHNMSGGGISGRSVILDGKAWSPPGLETSYPTFSQSSLGHTSDGYLLWNGILYRHDDENLYYSADGLTWEGPFTTGGNANDRIRSIAGLGQDIIVFLDSKILKFAPGDVMIALDDLPPRGISRPNGLCAITWQGNVYFTVGEKIIRFDGAGFLPMGPDLGEGAREQGGYITALFGDDTWLYCCTDSGATLAHNGQGWHAIGAGDEAIQYLGNGNLAAYTGQHWASGAIYSTTTASVMINTRRHSSIAQPSYAVYEIPGSAASPYRVGNYAPDYFSYFETDWFSGGIREVWKDFESIYIDGDNLSSGQGYVEVYWMDEGSTDWEYLGTVNQSGGQELRWSNPVTRPNTRRIRLRLHLFCNPSNVMRINAIRTKYAPMLTDRWRWSMVISVPPSEQEQLDGTMQTTYTQAQQVAHLDGLINRVPPFIMQDTDGLQYEVKIHNASRGVDEFEDLTGGTRIAYVYNLILEQVNDGTYTPPAP